MTRLCCIVLFGAGCLPTVGPAIDGGELAGLDGGSMDGGCASALDCASGVCQGQSCVAPASVCSAAFAGCVTFTDLTAASAVRVIRFPQGGDRYDPPCVRVRFGQSLTMQGGDFQAHPLSESCGPVASVLTASTGQSLTLTFNRALGTFGYFCDLHGTAGGSGMSGAIEVVR